MPKPRTLPEPELRNIQKNMGLIKDEQAITVKEFAEQLRESARIEYLQTQHKTSLLIIKNAS